MPGHLLSDLEEQGKISPLFQSDAILKEPFFYEPLVYKKNFSLELEEGKQYTLHFQGVDYHSYIFLNGHYLGTHKGSFSSFSFHITPFALPHNLLTVHLESLRKNPVRERTLRPPYLYGWDFAPKLPLPSIWEDVFLEVWEKARIQEVHVYGGKELFCDIAFEVQEEGKFVLELGIFKEGEAIKKMTKSLFLSSGQAHVKVTLFPVPLELWYPFEYGEQPLYVLQVRLFFQDKLLSEKEVLFGLRKVEMVKIQGDAFYFSVNGQRLFLKGAAWVPVDLRLGSVTQERVRFFLTKAKEAGIGVLRLWGGASWERSFFYEEASRLGILIWQEFPFACLFVHQVPRSLSFLKLVQKEASGIVRKTRNYPALLFYCGGNEFHPKKNSHLLRCLKKVVEKEAHLPFHPVSPFGKELHNWRVWHGFSPPYRLQGFPTFFLSEFGAQSLPCKEWEDWIEKSQAAQALVLKTGIEWMRLRQRKACGVLFWQFNEPWPAISWSILDYFGRPKKAYEEVKKLYQPCLPLCVFYKERTCVYLVNSTHKKEEGILELRGERKRKWQLVSLPFSVKKAGEIEAIKKGKVELLFQTKGGKTFINDYHLPSPFFFPLHWIADFYSELFERKMMGKEG